MPTDRDAPLYTISIAARLVRIDRPEEPIHPQTLRMYERLGLVSPSRVGKNRLYSERDIDRLRQIQRLTQDMGVNLAGVEVVLGLLEKIETLQAELQNAKHENHRLETALAAQRSPDERGE